MIYKWNLKSVINLLNHKTHLREKPKKMNKMYSRNEHMRDRDDNISVWLPLVAWEGCDILNPLIQALIVYPSRGDW